MDRWSQLPEFVLPTWWAQEALSRVVTSPLCSPMEAALTNPKVALRSWHRGELFVGFWGKFPWEAELLF